MSVAFLSMSVAEVDQMVESYSTWSIVQKSFDNIKTAAHYKKNTPPSVVEVKEPNHPTLTTYYLLLTTYYLRLLLTVTTYYLFCLGS